MYAQYPPRIIPADRNVHTNNDHLLIDWTHSKEMSLDMDAASAIMKIIAEPVKPTYSIGGWIAIKKFCSNGFSPFPFWTTISEETGSNGFAIKFERRIKKEKIKDKII